MLVNPAEDIDPQGTPNTTSGSGPAARAQEFWAGYAPPTDPVGALEESDRADVRVVVDATCAGVLSAGAAREYGLAGGTMVLRQAPPGRPGTELLSQAGADFALVCVPEAYDSLDCIEVTRCRRRLVVGRCHPLAHRRAVALHELQGMPELQPKGACPEWLRQFTVAGLTGQPPRWAGTFEMLGDGLRMAAAGQGALVAPDLAGTALARPDLTCIEIAGLEPAVVRLLWDPRYTPTGRLAAVLAAFHGANGANGAPIAARTAIDRHRAGAGASSTTVGLSATRGGSGD
jgi:hypothetical protein